MIIKQVAAHLLSIKKDRSLIAHVSAAEHYSIDHFNSAPIQNMVNTSEMFYITGFFILSSLPTCLAIGQHCVQHNKVMMLNISAPFIVEHHWEKFNSVLQYADYVCGNEHEAQALGNKIGLNTTDLREIATKISQLPKINNNKKRTVIITQGAKDTIVYHNDELHSFSVQKIDKNLIVDTNGAGDSFIGGFLAGYMLGKNLAKSIDAGHYCAGVVIQKTGCDLSSECTYNWDQ